MDLFRRVIGTLGGESKAGISPDFPYELGELLAASDAAEWNLYAGRALKLPSTPSAPGVNQPKDVTVHVANVRSKPARLQMVRAVVRRLRTLRHPLVLRYVASTEIVDSSGTVTTVYLATEPALPLDTFLRNEGNTHARSQALFLAHGVLSGLHFLHADAGLVHGSLWDSKRSLMVTRAGEARMTGFATAWGRAERPSGDLGSMPSAVASEIEQAWRTCDFLAAQRADLKCAAMLLRPMLEQSGALAPQLSAALDHAIGADSQVRPTVSVLVEAVARASAALGAGDLVGLCARLDALSVIADDAGRAVALSDLASRRKDLITALPCSFVQHRVLPTLEALFGVFPSAVTPDAVCLYATSLSCVCTSKPTPTSENIGTATPHIGDGTAATLDMLFGRQDRAVRAALLECLSADVYTRLDTRTVQESVFPRLAAGFADGAPMLRDMTLKASLHLVPRLTARQLHGELARAYARLQTDSEPGVRVNAAVCFARASPYLVRPNAHPNDPGTLAIRGAIAHAVRDQFAPARCAGLGLASACVALLPPAELAMYTLPAVCPLLIDATPDVRALALQTVRALLARVESSLSADEKRQNAARTNESECVSGTLVDCVPQATPPAAVVSPTADTRPEATWPAFAQTADDAGNPWSDGDVSASHDASSVRPLVLGSRPRLGRRQ